MAVNQRRRATAFSGSDGVVEPIVVPKTASIPIRRAGGRYVAEKKKLTLPLRYFKLGEGDNLLGPIARFLEEMIGG